jgi:subtilase family serine protease
MLFPKRLPLSRSHAKRSARRPERTRRRGARRDLAFVPGPVCCGPTVEELEGRQMLSATISAAAGVAVPTLIVEGRVTAPSNKPTINPNNASAPYTPQEVETAYGVNLISFNGIVGNGKGQTIAIVDAYNDPNIISDTAEFNSNFGLPQFNQTGGPTFQVLNENGGTALPPNTNTTVGDWDLEESLDVQWAHSMAPQANIILFESTTANDPDMDQAEVTAAGWPGVSVVSNSWGEGEFTGENSEDQYFQTPTGHQGVTFFASAGDSGSPAGYPAYSPYVVSVGGTNLQIQSSGTYISESVWNNNNGWATGGGISTQESLPYYQDNLNGINGASTTNRNVPDVSADADPDSGVYVYDTWNEGQGGSWFQVGGTSLASPLWAGMMSIVDQGRVLAGESTLDGYSQTLPMLYSLPSSDFHDVTTGSNGTYSAAPGYDLVTGLGTPVANLLVPALAGYGTTSPTVSSPTSATVTEDNSITFSPANGNQITVGDPFSAGNPDSLTVSVSDGTLSLGSTTGLTFTAGANGSASFTVTGTVTNLNADLNGLTYTPTTSYTGSDTLNVSLTDPGESLTGSKGVAITVNPFAAPAITAPSTQTVSENGSLVFSAGNSNAISFTDQGAGINPDTVTLSVSHGTLTLGTTNGIIFTSGFNGSASFTIRATVTNLNAALAGLTYVPTSSYAGPDLLAIQVNDPTDNKSGSTSVAITVSALAPSISAPTSASVTENSSLSFSSGNGNAITLTDANPSTDALTLSVTHGTLTLSTTSGLTFTAGSNDSASFTVTGSLSSLNAALSGLVYQPTASFYGSDTLAISLLDQGDTLSTSKNVALTVNPLAAPSITAPASATTTENASIIFSSANGNTISVTDSAAGGNSDSFSLSVSHGTLTLSTISGLTFTSGGNGSASFTVKGTVSSLNAALSGLTYAPTSAYFGSDSLAISITDPGDNESASKSVAITINQFNPPTITAPTSATAPENGSLVFSPSNGDAITVNDGGPGSSSESMTLGVSHGTLTLSTTAGLTFTSGSNGAASFTVTGSIANLNTALSGLTYKPTSSYIGSDSLSALLRDTVDNLSTSTSVALTVTGTTPPSIQAPSTARVQQGATVVFSTAKNDSIVISDTSAGSATQELTVKASVGPLTLATTSGITFISGANGTSSMTIEGTLANLNAALNGLAYTLQAKAATITLAYNDLGNNLSATATISITSSTATGFTAPATKSISPVSGPTVSPVSPDTETTSTDDQTQGFLAAVEVLAT